MSWDDDNYIGGDIKSGKVTRGISFSDCCIGCQHSGNCKIQRQGKVDTCQRYYLDESDDDYLLGQWEDREMGDS